MTFTLKSYEEYPSFNPQTTEDGKSSLTCTSLDTTHKITYNFQNNALSNIVSSIDLASTIPDYEQIALNYQTQALTYNSKPGIISNFLIFNEGFNVTTNVDLSVASRSYIFEADTFSKNTEPKVVKFEMESQGYTCN